MVISLHTFSNTLSWNKDVSFFVLNFNEICSNWQKVSIGSVTWNNANPAHLCFIWVNTLRPEQNNLQLANSIFSCTSWKESAAYVHHPPMWSLSQIMACRLFSTKTFSKLMLAYYQLNSLEHISVKSNKNAKILFKKINLQMRYANWWPFFHSRNVLTTN